MAGCAIYQDRCATSRYSQSMSSTSSDPANQKRTVPDTIGLLGGLKAVWPAAERPLWERLLTISAGLYAVVVTVWLLVALGPSGSARPEPPGAASLLVSLPLVVLAIALSWRAAGVPSLDLATRRFWKIVTGVLVVSALMSAVPLIPVFSEMWFNASLRAAISMGMTIALLIGMLRLPSAPRTSIGRTALWFDMMTLMIGGWLVAWYDLNSSTIVRSPELTGALWLEYVQGVSALVAAQIAIVMWRRTSLVHRATALMLVGSALGLIFVGHLAQIRQLHGRAFFAESITVVLPVVCLLFSLAAQATSVTLFSTAPRSQIATRGFGLSIVPAIAILPGFGLLLLIAYRENQRPLLVLILGTSVLTVLAFARQYMASFLSMRKLAAVTARESEARFRALVQNSSDVIMIVGVNGEVLWVSPSSKTVFGHDSAALAGKNILTLVHQDDRDNAAEFLGKLADDRVRQEAAASGQTAALKYEWRFYHANGTWMTIDIAGTNMLDEQVIRGLVLNCRDVSEQSLIKEQYAHQAFHDPLTDLANRSLFLYQVGHALSKSARDGSPVALLFFDLDNFKTVNDSLGHAAGDNLLVDAARRLASCVRSTDIIARLGGDEFAVLMEKTETVEEVLAVASRIGAALSRPFVLNNKEVFVSASIGIARSEPGQSSDEIVRNADVAMYVAKGRGKGQHVLFEKQMHEAAVERLVIEADLRRAVDNEEFFLQYQPIVCLETGHIIGAEALVRWLSRDRGLVPPGVFISIAERTGLIVPIGKWVLRRACIEARRWTRDRGVPVRISVNLSGRQLQDETIVSDVREVLEDTGLDPRQLVLELTESILMQNTEMALDRLLALKELGVGLAIDDFGTGYSSLSYLQRYPVDILKIDKSFVDTIDKGGEGSVLANAIVALGDTLQMSTVAEGIETEAQRDRLIEIGCELGQGYLFSRPVDGQDFWHLLQTSGACSPYVSRRLRGSIEHQAA